MTKKNSKFESDFAPLEEALRDGQEPVERIVVELYTDLAATRRWEIINGRIPKVHLLKFSKAREAMLRHGLLPRNKESWEQWLERYRERRDAR